MNLNKNCISCCEELIKALPEGKQKNYKSLLAYEDMSYIDELHEGLTYLAISCMELGVLFSKFEKEKSYDVVVQRMTIGYLFEVYHSIWEWIGKAIRNICAEKNVDITDYLSRKKVLF